MHDPVLWPIAVSLSQQDWTLTAIHADLTSRLPRTLFRLVRPAARRLIADLPGSTTPDPATIFRVLRTMPLAAHLRDHARTTGTAPARVLTPTPFRPAAALAALPLPRLESADDLATFLAITPAMLTRLADLRGLSAHNPSPYARHYNLHRIPKSDGTLRQIEEPKPLLKSVQRRILHGILALVPPHSAAHGFIKGRSAVQAAAKHCAEPMVVCFDLKDFFPSIPFTRLYAIFRSLGYPRAVALPLTGLCTALPPTEARALSDGFRNRHLPQGAPTSPALANLSALRLDARLSGLARSLDATYTRYADDLTFSGDATIAPRLLRALPRIAAAEGFRLNPTKTRSLPAHASQKVTGIQVNHHVNLPRRDHDLLKAMIHRLQTTEDPAFLAHLSGRISWAEQLNPARAARLRARFDALFERKDVADAPPFP